MNRLSVFAIAFAIGALAPLSARGEESHHQGSSPAQVAPLDTDRLVRDGRNRVYLRAFSSFLTAGEKFNSSGDRVALAEGSRVSNVALNFFAEFRLSRIVTLSAATAGQVLIVDGNGASRTVVSLADSFLSGRFGLPLSWGTVAGALTIKVPGSYPESEATGASQLDFDARALIAVRKLGWSRLAAVAGVGYKVRLGGIEDELSVAIIVPVRVLDALTVTPSFTGGIAIGAGGQKKDTLAVGLALTLQLSERVDLVGAYYRTVYGHNVVDAHVATLGAGFAI